MADQAEAAAHWDDAYTRHDRARSWIEEQPQMSLQMLGAFMPAYEAARSRVGTQSAPV